MSRKVLAGNWKMNLDWNEASSLASLLEESSGSLPSNVKVIIAPPAPYLSALAPKMNNIKLAAQNVSDQESGAYTGEWSASMLESLGIDHCIVGHSERRSMFGDTDPIISRKVDVLLKHDITPIFCFGELLEERNAERHFEIVQNQVNAGLFHLLEEQFSNVILAYEPVWAIGTGVTASSEQAQEMHAFIRGLIRDHYSEEIAEASSILYGGSAKPANGDELFACPDVDGGLIGGAALKAEDFITLIKQNGNS